MQAGMVFTSFVSYLVFASALLAGVSTLRNRDKKDDAVFSYSAFLLMTAVAWFFVASSLFAMWLGKEGLGKLFFLTNQILIFCSGVPLSFYLILKTWGKGKVLRAVVAFYVAGAFLCAFLSIFLGVVEGESTYFVSKFQPNQSVFLVFIILVTPLLIVALMESVRKVTLWAKSRESAHLHDFSFAFIIIVYLFLGVLDESGFIVDWPLVFFRLLFVAVFFLAYLVDSFRSLKKEKFVLYNK